MSNDKMREALEAENEPSREPADYLWGGCLWRTDEMGRGRTGAVELYRAQTPLIEAALAAQPATVRECGCANYWNCAATKGQSPKPVLTLAAAPKPEQQEAPAERECRHCGFLCRPNPAESRKWYPLEQAEPSGNPGEFAAPAGEQVGLTDAELWAAIDNHVERLQRHAYEYGLITEGTIELAVQIGSAAIAAHEAKRNGGAS